MMQEPEKKFSDYEFFIFVLTVFHSNQYAQSLSIPQQQALLKAIRQKHCPKITNKDWLNIELNIVKHRNIMMDSMLDSALSSTGAKENTMDMNQMASFDYAFSKELSNFDFEEIKQNLQQNGIADSKIDGLFDLLESKKSMFSDS